VNKKIALFLSLLLSGCAVTQPPTTIKNLVTAPSYNQGMSGIGLCSPYADRNAIVHVYDNAPKIIFGWLNKTFNESCPIANDLMQVDKPKLFRATAINATCFPERGRHCESYECFAGMSQSEAERQLNAENAKLFTCIDNQFAKLKALSLKAHKNTLDFYVAVLLEAPFKKPARQKVFNHAEKYFDKAHLVDSVINDSCITGYNCEKHSFATPPVPFVDTDGSDILQYNGVYKWLRSLGRSKSVMAWSPCINGVGVHDTVFQDPRKRTKFCTSREWKWFSYFVNPRARELAPLIQTDVKGCKQTYPSEDGSGQGFLLKLGDGKSIAVALFPNTFRNKFGKVTIIKNGKQVDTGRYREIETEKGSGRMIYDFNLHPASLPDNSVLHADSNCWVLKKPQFRID